MDLAPLLSDDPREPAPCGAAPGIDVDAFRALFERMKEPLFRFLPRLCRDPDDAEDLVQDTVVRALAAYPSSAVGQPHLFANVAVPNLCAA